MLILSRRLGEKLMIGDTVTITVVRITGNEVRVGIDAPKDIPVHRQEIYNKIKREQSGQPAAGRPTSGSGPDQEPSAGNDR